jgi:hypothetical protein
MSPVERFRKAQRGIDSRCTSFRPRLGGQDSRYTIAQTNETVAKDRILMGHAERHGIASQLKSLVKESAQELQRVSGSARSLERDKGFER